MRVKVRQTTTPGGYVPSTVYEECVGFLTFHRFFITCAKACETGPVREDQKVKPFADVITKAALSPQLFKDPECWSGRDLNLRPPAPQTGAYPIELTGRRVENKDLFLKFTFYYSGSHIYHREELAIRFVCLTSMMTFIVTAVFGLVTQGSLRDETKKTAEYQTTRTEAHRALHRSH